MLGLDSFSLAFFQCCWEIVRDDVMRFSRDFFEHFKRSLNATFVACIPKKIGAVDVKEFNLISLIGSVYMTLAQVLANRLKAAFGKLLSHFQNAFIKGRQSLDSVLLVKGCLDSRVKSSLLGALCKLDLEKGYDHVNWNFLIHLLSICGFGEKWKSWIRFCISIVRFSILEW